MFDSDIPESLVVFLHAVSEDRELTRQLLSLERLPLASRQSTLREMAEKMRTSGEDSAVADAVEALTLPHFYEAACSTLRELLA